MRCGADYYKQKHVNQNVIKEQQEKRGTQRDELTVLSTVLYGGKHPDRVAMASSRGQSPCMADMKACK